MPQEDIVSQKLMLPISMLQKMPVDQISCLHEMILTPPETFRIDPHDVTIDTLIGSLKSHGLQGREVLYRDFSLALSAVNIDMAAISLPVREKLIGSLSRNPKTTLISVPLFLSLYRFWKQEYHSKAPIENENSSSQRSHGYYRPNSSSPRNDKLVDNIRVLLPSLLLEISATGSYGAISEAIFNSSLRVCGVILAPVDVKFVWAHILRSTGRIDADGNLYNHDNHDNMSGMSATVSFQDISRVFSAGNDSSVSGRHHFNSSTTPSTSIVAAIMRDIPAPPQRKAVTHQLSSVVLTDSTDQLPARDRNILGFESASSASFASSISNGRAPLRYQHSLGHSENHYTLRDEAANVSNTQRRVLSHLMGMTPGDKEYFAELLTRTSSTPSASSSSSSSSSSSVAPLSHISLFSALSNCNIHLNTKEREDFWAETLSGCSLQSPGGRGPRDATTGEFFQWIGFPPFVPSYVPPSVPSYIPPSAAPFVSSYVPPSVAHYVPPTSLACRAVEGRFLDIDAFDNSSVYESSEKDDHSRDDYRGNYSHPEIDRRSPLVYDRKMDLSPPPPPLLPQFSYPPSLSSVQVTPRPVDIILDDLRSSRGSESISDSQYPTHYPSNHPSQNPGQQPSHNPGQYPSHYPILPSSKGVDLSSSMRRMNIPQSRLSTPFSISSQFSQFSQVESNDSPSPVNSNAFQYGRKQVQHTGQRVGVDSVSSLFSLNSYRLEASDDDKKKKNIALESNVPPVSSSSDSCYNSPLVYPSIENKEELISELQRQLVLLAIVFRKLMGITTSHTKEKLVKCIDFARALLSSPLSLKTTLENAWLLTCEIANQPVQCDPMTATIAYSDVTRYLDNNKDNRDKNDKYYVGNVSDVSEVGKGIEVHSPTDAIRSPTLSEKFHDYNSDIQYIEGEKSILTRKADFVRKSIIQKLSDSKDIKGDRIRLLALTPLLRIRLRRSLGRGEIGVSWDSSLDFCSIHELMRLCQSVDVCFTLDEVLYLSSAISDEKDCNGSSSGVTSNSVLKGITLSKAMLFLADLITQHSLS